MASNQASEQAFSISAADRVDFSKKWTVDSSDHLLVDKVDNVEKHVLVRRAPRLKSQNIVK